MLGLLAFLLAAPSPEEVKAVAHRVLERSTYQTRLPTPGEAREGGGGRAPAKELPGDERSTTLEAPEAAASIARTLLVVVAVVGGVLAALWIGRELASFRWGAEPVSAPPAPPPDPGAPAIPDPEALAKEGRFAEAAHALLLRAIERVAASRPRSLTAREVLASATPALRPALAPLVDAVERSRFGGRPLDGEKYAALRAAARGIEA